MADLDETKERITIGMASKRDRQKFEEISGRGINESNGFIQEEWNRKLQGRQGMRRFREMRDADATVGASALLYSSFFKSVKWSPEPGTGPRAQEAADFLGEVMEDMSHTWSAFIDDVQSKLYYGWAFFEQVWKYREGPGKDPSRRSKYTDGRIGIRKLKIIPQENLWRWEIADDGGVTGLWVRDNYGSTAYMVPMAKGLHFKTENARGNPEGRSLLRALYRSYYRKTHIEDFEAIGIERNRVGIPKGTMPLEFLSPSANEDKKAVRASFELLLKSTQNNSQGYSLTPAEEDKNGKTGWSYTLMQTAGDSVIDTVPIINRYDRNISRGLLTQFMFLGMDKAGTQALGSELTTVLATALGGWLDGIEETFNRFCVQPLMNMNGFFDDDVPSWKHGEVTEENASIFAQNVERLIRSGGINADESLEQHLRERFDLPEAEENEDEADEVVPPELPPVEVEDDPSEP